MGLSRTGAAGLYRDVALALLFGPPATDLHIYTFRAVDVNVLANLFFGLVAWAVFAVLEPFVMWLGTRQEPHARLV